MKKKVVIIGAGIAGLSTASYLHKSGFDTEIYEMHDLPGGLCTSWERKKYTIDGCIHWLIGTKNGSSLNKMWGELIDINSLDFVYSDSYGTFVDAEGNLLNMFTDPDKLETELMKLSPDDEKYIKQFCKLIRKFNNFEPPADSTPEIMKFSEKISLLFKMLRYLPDLSKYMKISLEEFASNFRNPLIRFAFANLFVPEMSLIFVIINFAWFNQTNAAYPIGGSLNFSRLLEKNYLAEGGKIFYKSKVTKILTEQDGKNHIAKGILLDDGREIFADIVISAADLHYTLINMLDDKFTGSKWRNRFNNFTTFNSYIQVSLGINRKFDVKYSKMLFQTKDTFRINDNEILDTINFRIHDFDPTLTPEGKTLITTLIEVSDYKYWTDLRLKNIKEYRRKKKEIADFFITEAERHIGDFRNDIEMLDISTPATVIRYTGNWKGSYEGWVLNKQTGFNSFERELTGLKNFYLAGQWVEPGGGLPTALMSGRNLTQIICKKNGLNFMQK